MIFYCVLFFWGGRNIPINRVRALGGKKVFFSRTAEKTCPKPIFSSFFPLFAVQNSGVFSRFFPLLDSQKGFFPPIFQVNQKSIADNRLFNKALRREKLTTAVLGK